MARLDQGFGVLSPFYGPGISGFALNEIAQEKIPHFFDLTFVLKS